MCASALESARILLNSTSTRWPDGLANSSGQLGRNLMDHTMGGGANGSIIGRNTFQRPREEALQMLDTIIKIYQGKANQREMPAVSHHAA